MTTTTQATPDATTATQYAASRDGTRIAYEVHGAGPALVIVDDTHAPNAPDVPARVQELVDRGERGEAVKTFMRLVGVPAPFIGLMRVLPAWKKMTGVAHTLPYDLAIVTPYQQGEPLPAGR